MRAILVALVLSVPTWAGAQTFQVCQWVLAPSATFLKRNFFAGTPNGLTLTSTGCHCRGTCSTAAQFSWEDKDAFAISLTGGGNLACQTGLTAVSFTTFDVTDGDRMLTNGEELAFNVTNTPTSTDEVLLCIRFTTP